MKLEIADCIELVDGGATLVMELDEEARLSLISEAIQRRIMEGLKRMPDVTEEDRQIDLEEYLKSMEEA